MFENCHLRIGEAPFTSCMPLSAQLLGSLYALPQSTEKPLREALDALGDNVPWAESFAVAPEQTTGAVGAMLRHIMMATRDLEPTSVMIDALPGEGRARPVCRVSSLACLPPTAAARGRRVQHDACRPPGPGGRSLLPPLRIPSITSRWSPAMSPARIALIPVILR